MVAPNGWFIMENMKNPIEVDDWEVPLFQETTTWFGYVWLSLTLTSQNLHRNAGNLRDGHCPIPRSPVLLRSAAKLAKRAVEAASRRLPGSCRSHPNRAPLDFKLQG